MTRNAPFNPLFVCTVVVGVFGRLSQFPFVYRVDHRIEYAKIFERIVELKVGRTQRVQVVQTEKTVRQLNVLDGERIVYVQSAILQTGDDLLSGQ